MFVGYETLNCGKGFHLCQRLPGGDHYWMPPLFLLTGVRQFLLSFFFLCEEGQQKVNNKMPTEVPVPKTISLKWPKEKGIRVLISPS